MRSSSFVLVPILKSALPLYLQLANFTPKNGFHEWQERVGAKSREACPLSPFSPDSGHNAKKNIEI